MMQTCTVTGEQFEVTDREEKMCKTMGIPLPTICPDENMRRQMAFRNEYKLFQRKCDKTGEDMISAYPEGTPFPVWKNELWWGDSWDATDFGRDYDFSANFFDQLKDLQNVVPREGTSVFRCENCPYNGHCRDSKNCHMNTLLASCEDTYYSAWALENKDIMDCFMVFYSELCYDCSHIRRCYECVKLEECYDCQNCYFSYQLRGCDHCIGCANLYKKSYHVFNKPVSKEEFAAMKEKVLDGSIQTYEQGQKFLEKIKQENYHRATHNLNAENITGDHMHDSKNCHNCFDGHDSEDCFNSISLGGSADTHRCYSAGWPKCEVVYASSVSRGSNNIAYCYYTFYGKDLRYCDSCQYCNNCFGCVGLNHKEYCILNKQYTKEEYEALLPKVIEHMTKTGEWGQPLPPSFSTFAYNDSAADYYFPLDKKSAEKLGYQWRDEPERKFQSQTYTVPGNIKDVPDSICNEILACEKTRQNFRIQSGELKFYRKMSLPIPKVQSIVRMRARVDQRNPFKLFTRKSALSGKEVMTSIPPDSPYQVISEEEFQNLVA